MSAEGIEIVGRDTDEEVEEVRSFGWFIRRGTVAPETLRDSLRKFMSSLEEALQGTPINVAGYEVEELQLALEVTAKGSVALLGTGGEVGGKGGITLTLRRSRSDVTTEAARKVL